MDVEVGRRLGPYEIVSKIGAGGMGEVWRARDTRLERNVAVKVLPPTFAGNEQFRLRFEREAKTISQLNHPNVCIIHDVGNQDGISYLVMELLEGETLAERLARGRMPMTEVIRVGAQVAEALGRAHRAGIIHRDLKPGNVMLTSSGAKLLDFGLARAAALSINMEGATEQMPLTAEGTIMGTFQYMAPEQLEGTEADARTDIFALGNVLYEMSTGKRAFDGKTKTSLIAAIVERDPPPIRESQPLTPPAFEHVVAKCLAKEPDDRWQNALDIAEELRWISGAGSQAGVAAPIVARRHFRERALVITAILLALGLAAALVWTTRVSTNAAQIRFTDIAAPPRMRFNAVGDVSGPIVISPDGRHAVYSVIDKGLPSLWLRSFVTGETKVMSGTAGGIFPFWSPDSRNVGFYLGSKLMRTDLTGSAPVPICDSLLGRGATWGTDGWIVFSPLTQEPLSRIKATGGTPEVITRIELPHTSHRWPSFMPDGKHFLYLATNHRDPQSSVNAIYLGSIEGGTPKLILRSTSNAVYSDGYLLFQREATLYAQKMSEAGELSGEPIAIVQDVLYDAGIWRSAFSVSDEGTLVYHSGKATLASRIKWVDRAGKDLGEVGTTDNYWDVELSPNDQKLAVAIGDPNREMWIVDLQRNSRSRLAVEASYVDQGVWFPDGSGLYVDVLRRGEFVLLAKQLAGAERALLTGHQFPAPRSVSSDGTNLLIDGVAGEGIRLPIKPPGKPVQLRGNSPSLGGMAAVYSPDDRWIAGHSEETGRIEIFVESATDPNLRWQVSTEGGVGARWRQDGKEMYYVDLEGRINAVPVEVKGNELEIGMPQPLFAFSARPAARAYDVTADGQRFLINVIANEESPVTRVMTNWRGRVKK